MYTKKKNIIKQIALERIDILFEMIKKKEYNLYKKRYIELIFEISMRYRVHIPLIYKRSICKKCKTYLLYGTNSRVRIKNKCKIITCFNCGNKIYIPYK